MNIGSFFRMKQSSIFINVSTPIKSIVGIMHLNKMKIENWKINYTNDENTLQKIDTYLQHHKYVLEIAEFKDVNRISIVQLRNDVPDFVVPQMYYFIDGAPLLGYLGRNLIHLGGK